MSLPEMRDKKSLPEEGRVDFESCRLDDQHSISRGELPVQRVLNPMEFEHLWDMHPADFHLIKIHGDPVRTPRWQQAFGRDFHYSGQVNSALPVPPILQPLLDWACSTVDARLNGLLVNWYDGQKGHYIGAHRDSTVKMVEGVFIRDIGHHDNSAVAHGKINEAGTFFQGRILNTRSAPSDIVTIGTSR